MIALLREIPPPPETWPIIEHEPEHIPDVPPDFVLVVTYWQGLAPYCEMCQCYHREARGHE